MKSIITYYSMTGNTKRIAEAIQAGLKQATGQCDLVRLEQTNVDDLPGYDLIGLGSFVSGYQEPAPVTDFLGSLPDLKGKLGFSFCTHGTCVAGYVSRVVKALRRKGLTVTGWNDWYGDVFIPVMAKPYYTAGHPDEIDLEEARQFGRDIAERSQRIARGERNLVPRLPKKDVYDKRYGVPTPPEEMPEAVARVLMSIVQFKPTWDREKCRYPKCTICMDSCPTHSIDLSGPEPVSYETCGPCLVWLCEQLCPTSAMQVDWRPIDDAADLIKEHYGHVAESMIEFKDLRHFRSLIPPGTEGTEKPLYKRAEHPKLVVRNGVVQER